jgi:hypothetical protein
MIHTGIGATHVHGFLNILGIPGIHQNTEKSGTTNWTSFRKNGSFVFQSKYVREGDFTEGKQHYRSS